MMSLYDEEEVMRSYIRSERYEAAQKAAKKAAKKAEQDKARKTAIRLIRLGKMSLDDIAEATELSLDIVKELADEVMQMA